MRVQWMELHPQILKKTDIAPTDFEDICTLNSSFGTKIEKMAIVYHAAVAIISMLLSCGNMKESGNVCILAWVDVPRPYSCPGILG